MKTTIVILVTTILSIAYSYGQGLTVFQKKKLDSLFAAIEANDKGMGGISIFRDGKEVYSKFYGFSSLADQKKATDKTRYRIGSMSKMFTAVIVLKQIEDGKLSLDTKLSRFFPKISNAEKITIENLLRHRSGLANFTEFPDYPSWKERSLSEQELLEKIYSFPVNFTPNEKFEYSNTNYLILSLIAQQIDKQSFSNLLKTYIINPCKLENTLISEKINVSGNEAQSYIKMLDWQLESETSPSVSMGAGAITSTAYDLNLFFKALFDGKLLNAESLKMIQSFRDGHSLGFQEFAYKDLKGIGHGGRVDGFQSYGSYFADHKTSVVFTSNAILYPMYDIWVGALHVIFNYPYNVPVFYTPDSKDLQKYTGAYANPNFPFKFNISIVKNMLVAEGDGKSLALEYVKDHTFKFDLIGLVLEFRPEEGKMLFKQNGGEMEFKKE